MDHKPEKCRRNTPFHEKGLSNYFLKFLRRLAARVSLRAFPLRLIMRAGLCLPLAVDQAKN
jgi:hypothetical protein